MRAPPLLLLIALLLPHPATAAAVFDPRQADIVGLRLGMGQQDVADRLAAQGATRIHAETGPCATDLAATCTQLLSAPTHDGTLLIRFVAHNGPGSETAWSIAYTLNGRGAGEPEMIRNAVLDHFGPPTGNDPPLWCATGSAAGCNPADQPQLVFIEGPDTSSTLTLSDPSALGSAP